MKLIRLIILSIIIVAIISGCAAPVKKQSAPSLQSDPATVESSKTSNPSGTSLVGLFAVLERIEKSQKPLTRFPTEIHSLKKISNLEYIFTIDKIELNDKYEDSALSQEPFYFNKDVKKEEIVVPYDAVLNLSNDIPMPVGEEFIQYVNENKDEKGNPIYIYYFYLCGDEVEFIQDIYIA